MLDKRFELTYASEGTEQGPFHSRILHWPGGKSGVTLGRGKDFTHDSMEEAAELLYGIGVEITMARRIALCAGLKGEDAGKFITWSGLDGFEITMDQQESLFEITYAEIEADAKRICTKKDVVDMYGYTDWDGLNPLIRAVYIDLRYRGDLTSGSRKMEGYSGVRLQVTVSFNYLEGFAEIICDRSLWPNVPEDRFNRRCDWLRVQE